MPTSFKDRDIISISDLDKADILTIIKTAKQIKAHPQPHLLKNKVMASCFFEPSTRTRLSFETAMQRLGGSVVGFTDGATTSTKKGETLHDTMKMVEGYADVIVLRHYLEGAARHAARSTTKPVINCGDGANQHPTQTLIDLYTILECQKKLNDLHIALVGDLKYGRTVHSLAEALRFFGARLYFVAPEPLQMPDQVVELLREHNITFSCHENIEEVVRKVDILYMTRIQAERFADPYEYERVKNIFVLNAKMLNGSKRNLRILHPLPRVNEINFEIDALPEAYYFEQAANGIFVRQALLALVLGKIK